ncbi:hypothetical protein AJ80_09006 [Polytolypa hystricis UAMH7299]|uniref:EXPERA domain-containing protein n=1 Tax=Polytolypa hystricis (strain UAMH7299) TaxID=1447883 RepID=A0A2B7WX72_POLH7|nr:hypothetical protein AJ80_09006 [Polytolypa hystricis UAMH7299]
MTTLSSIPFTLDVPTIFSLTAALSLLPTALFLSIALIPSSRPRDRFLIFWHAYDALTHFLIEGSYLYNCFFSFITLNAPSLSRSGPYFLNQADRLYGPAYGTGPTGRLWQEYGKADRRWLGADEGVIALELLTVILGGPAAAYVCYLVYKSGKDAAQKKSASASASVSRARGKMWFVASGLAVAELYGGFMTFAPEWLTGSTALDTSDPMYLWVYLVFFNGLWVVMPIYVLWAGWREVGDAFVEAAAVKTVEEGDGEKKRK